MKVLIVSLEYPPFGGGTAKATRKIARGLAENLEVHLVAGVPEDFASPKHGFPGKMEFYPVMIPKQSPHYWTGSELIRFLTGAFKRVFSVSTQFDYDVIHSFLGFPAGLIPASMLLGPHVISLRGSDVPGNSKRVEKFKLILYPVYRAIWNQASALVVNNPRLFTLARRFSPRSEILKIPNGVDTNQFSPGNRSFEPSTVNYLFAGRLVERKNPEILLRAFRQLVEQRSSTDPDCRLTLAGDGPRRVELNQLTDRFGLNDRVYFKGRVETDRMPRIYQEADVFVLPSAEEGMSNALLEAMASGLPVIVSENVGRELVDDNGIRCDHSIEGFADGMAQMLRNLKVREQMGKRSRKTAEAYSWGNVVSRYRDVYERIRRRGSID